MNDVGRYLDKIGASVCAVFDWTEKHPGLGGWVGAVGSILAILAAWYLARREYLRIKRQTAARRRAEIDLIGTVISEFDAIVKRYADAAITDKPEALHFFNNHMNDSELNGMYDLDSCYTMAFLRGLRELQAVLVVFFEGPLNL
jgi:hypothetical protein